jgi:hypothetical protein
MEFSGPQAADLANVTSLNHSFLVQLRASSRGRQWRRQLPPAVQVMIKGLTDLQIGRLAAAPFLLLSLRERDADCWRALAGDDSTLDLLQVLDGDIDHGQLSLAGLAFLWALAGRNPYAARLISGAPLDWCEQLADRTLLGLLQRAAGRRDLLQPRLATSEGFWRRMLGPGLSSERVVRQAAHLTALQSILTEDPAAHYRPMRAAACSTLVPTLRVTDRSRRN